MSDADVFRFVRYVDLDSLEALEGKGIIHLATIVPERIRQVMMERYGFTFCIIEARGVPPLLASVKVGVRCKPGRKTLVKYIKTDDELVGLIYRVLAVKVGKSWKKENIDNDIFSILEDGQNEE